MTAYEVLGISPDASLEEIRRAYHKGALKHHPDNYHQSPLEAETKFRKLAMAYKAALRAHIPKYEPNDGSKPYSPADFARMDTKWHTGRTNERYVSGNVERLAMQNSAKSRSVATVDENRVFVLAWALATVLGIVVVISATTLGLVGDIERGMVFSDLLISEMLALLVVVPVIAGAVYGIVLSRKTIWLTLQFGVRLLPFLPINRKPKQLPQTEAQER
ncbi:MAG: J domain-containing protein [Phycisphaerae bacterium]|nr:J domain-containing protein [Phycisphaerae bacterium]